MQVRRLVDFPYVIVRLRCETCKRAGAYRLARLAVKYGAEILLDDLIVRLSADCPWRRGDGTRVGSHPYRRRATAMTRCPGLPLLGDARGPSFGDLCAQCEAQIGQTCPHHIDARRGLFAYVFV